MGRFSIRCLSRLAIAAVLAALAMPAPARAADPKITVTHLSGPIYLVEDEHYATFAPQSFLSASQVTSAAITRAPMDAQ